MALHQRSNPYNKHLPFAGDVDSDADKFLAEIKDRLREAIRKNDLRGDASKWLFNLHKYVLLYGLRFSKEDHVWFARVAYEVFTTNGMDPVSLESIAKLLVSLLKKKYLLPREDLILDWKPLYELYHFWEDSSAAIRNMAKPTSEFKKNLQMLIRYSRSYFSDEATREMLNKWRPMLCPFDTSLETAMRYLMLFLPTSRHIPAEHTYELWLDEFLTLWRSFSNRPTWEVNLFYLLSRLAFHNTGRVDWSPHLESIFTHIMISLNVPVTYGGSGIKLKFGLSAVNDYAVITRWIVSVMEGGRGLVQKYLGRMFLAIESYYHPANSSNSAAENLHHFVSMLCYNYVHRVFLERHNKKYPCRIPEKSRLTDDDIDAFVHSVKPIAFHLLYNAFEDDRRMVFNILATLRPELIVPPLLEKLNSAFDTLTQPHRFTACIATVSSCSRVLVERYPAEAVDVLLMLLPGIDLNDIWKCAENFIVISDVFEVIWLVDFSNPESWTPGADPTPEERAVLAKTAMLEDFVLELTDKIMTLVENSSRINTRAETEAMDDALNDEEIAVDAAVADAFHKMVFRCSPKIFERVFKKVREYVRGKILEPAVAGTILAGMCKSVVSVNPTMCLDFFVPHLSDRVMTALRDKGDSKKADIELTFSLLLLAEVCSIRNVNFYPTECPLLPYMDKICAVLDATRGLINKEEYETANQLLQNTLFNLTHTRPLSRPLTQTEQPLLWSREVFAWGKTTGLESLEVSWYVPGEDEVAAAQKLLDRYLTPAVESLESLVARKVEMKKDEVLRNLRIIYRALHGSTDLLGRIPTDKKLMSLAADSMRSMERMQLKFRGENVRAAIQRLMHGVQTHLLSHSPDDVESLNALIVLMDVLLMSFGLDEDDLYDHVDEYRVIKNHRLNRLVQGKRHFPSVLVERIQIQQETYVWMKYALTEESLPVDLLTDLVELGISHYSDVRIYAQELLSKIIARTSPHSLRLILPRLIECLRKSPSVTHQMQKGALYILTGERFGFFYEWEFCARLMPVLVESQHSDKQSIDELLNGISVKVNRHYSDFGLYTLPIRKTRPSARLMQLVNDSNGVDGEMEAEDISASEVDEHFLELEKKMYELVSRKTLHWRHYSMGMGIMLLLVTHDRVPSPEAVEMWLQAMVHDDRSIRNMAFQALECIMKVSRRERKKCEKSIVPTTTAAVSGKLRPGLRGDNEFMQYRTMNGDELRDYWANPFSVKGYQGFYVWDEPAKLRVIDPGGTEDRFKDKYVDDLIGKYFSDQSYIEKVVEFNTTEHSKGEDEFSMDKALFFSYLFENFGDRFHKVLMPHLRKLSASGEESKQRFAAELCYGAIRGLRFSDYGVVSKLWADDLEPTLKMALEKVTLFRYVILALIIFYKMSTPQLKVSTETLADWGQCINGASNKCDPNRIRWMLETLLGASVPEGTLGAFREYAALRLLHKAIMHNWKAGESVNKSIISF